MKGLLIFKYKCTYNDDCWRLKKDNARWFENPAQKHGQILKIRIKSPAQITGHKTWLKNPVQENSARKPGPKTWPENKDRFPSTKYMLINFYGKNAD